MSQIPPVIIIGMHRSGTSMITRLLEQLRLFLGKNRDENAEPWFFLNLNRWLLQQSGGAWDYPDPFDEFLKHEEARCLTVDYLDHMLHSPRVASYMGWYSFIRYRTPKNLPGAWGWKDPRNTITLPVWLDLFPDARIIHIYRHGVDVAQSMRKRGNQEINIRKEHFERRKRQRVYWIKPRKDGFLQSYKVTSLSDGFALWESYMERAQKIETQYPNQTVSIQYETFLDNPSDGLKNLAEFCNLTFTKSQIDQIIQQVRPERRYAYREDESLRSFAQSVEEVLLKYGYKP